MEARHNGKADAWRQRIEDQRRSGQSIRAWCRASGVGEQSFYYWRQRLAGAMSGPGVCPPIPPLLARVKVVEAPIESFRLRLGGERELILPGSMPMARVAELVRALEPVR